MGISEGNYAKLAGQMLNIRDENHLKAIPGCYDVVLENKITGETYETQGDIPDVPGYTWHDFFKWLLDDIKEMGLTDQLDDIDLVSIEEAGLKGFALDDSGAQVSPKHAGFIVNNGGRAKASDVKRLMDHVT